MNSNKKNIEEKDGDIARKDREASQDRRGVEQEIPYSGDGNRGNKPAGGKGIEGRRTDRRILSTEEGKNLGGAGNVEASDVLRRNPGADTATQHKELVRWAKERGRFYSEADHKALKNQLTYDKSRWGIESEVYFDIVNGTVTKVMYGTVSNFNVVPSEFLLHRITLHNKYFSESRYKLRGIMNHGNRFAFVTEQPTIKGDRPTKEEISEFLLNIGFSKDRFSWKITDEFGNLIRLSDTHQGNFIKDENGYMYCIDSVFEIADQ